MIRDGAVVFVALVVRCDKFVRAFYDGFRHRFHPLRIDGPQVGVEDQDRLSSHDLRGLED